MLKFFNTLTSQLEAFTPLEDNIVRMYSCGPTVYDFAHIGNFRSFLFTDVLHRYLKYRGYQVTFVMNITDIDDKIIERANQTGQNIRTFTDEYLQYFLEDMKQLDMQFPHHIVRATDHISEMVELVHSLIHNGHAYESEGSVYFRINSFDGYGKLSGAKLEGNKAGARISTDEYEKDDVRDFVLWKGVKPNEPSWPADFGEGRPGWHLECSAMSMKYLGESFDIHCGGVDLVFPHHENEIAQSEGASGKPFVKYWLHAEHLQINGGKMSKRLGNFFTVRDLLEKGYHPRAIRLALISVPYRKSLNFTIDGLEGTARRLERLTDFARRLREARPVEADDTALMYEIEKSQEAFEAGMDDDLNTAQGLAAVTLLETALNRAMAEERLTEKAKTLGLDVLGKMDGVFGFFDPFVDESLDAEIQALVDERLAARKAKNFARSDEIRQILADRGIILEDTRDGTRWKRK